MKKSKLIGKVFGIALVFVMIGAMFGGLPNNIANAATKFDIGDTVEVTANLNVRTGPGTSYPEITDPDYPGYAPKGTIGKILSGPSSANGYIWWKVDFGPGLYSGWSVEDGLKKVPPSPPTLKSPSNNSEIIDDLTPTFAWYSVSDADYYGLYISQPPYGPSHLVYDNDGPIYGTSLPLPGGILSYGIKYCWNMRSHNEAGWGDFSDSWYFTVAYTPPPPPTAPTLTDVVGTSNNVLLGWTDNSNNEDGFKVERKEEISGTYTQIGTTGANVNVYADSGLQFGKVYCYRVRAYNSAGNSGYSSQKCATTLSTPILSSPANGATLNTNTVTLTWNPVTGANGYAIKVSKISCGGGDIFNGASISCQQQISNLANGVYYWQVQAAATTYPGLSAYSPCRYFTVTTTPSDTTDPNVSISSPYSGQTFTTSTITVSGTASDNVGLSKVEVKVGSGSWQQASGTTSWSKQVTLSPGSNTIYAKATDTSGNPSNQASVTVTYIPPDNPPTISIGYPSNGDTFTTPTITVSGTASDDKGVSKVEVRVGAGSWELASGTTSWSKQVTLSPDSNTIYAKATDTSGNPSNQASVTVTYTPTTTPLSQLIQQEATESVPVTVDGQQYLVVTLRSYIDPVTLQCSPSSETWEVYVDTQWNPISDGDIAHKIGIIETARGIGDPQLSQRIAVLGELREEVSQTSGQGWVNIVTSGVVDHMKWQKVYNFNDFMQYWDPARTTWHNLKTATTKSPPAGLLAKAATALLQKILGDPFGEVEDDLQNSLSSAISYYDSIEGIDNIGITDYDEAYRFLSNLYYGKSKEEIAAYLNYKLCNNIINLLDNAGPVASILTLVTNVPLIGQALALLEFPKLAWEAKLATDWTVDALYQDVLKQYEIRADLLYELTDNAKYSLYLAQAHEEVTSYKMKYLEEIETGYTEAAKIPQAVFDYLANFDWDSFICSMKQIILQSPGELRVYDSQGRVTGLVNGEIKEEIPDSVYADEKVLIFNSADSYRYEVVGTDQGTYGLEMGFREGEEVEGLALTNVPIVLGEVHKYTVDGGALSSGQATITVGIDSEGDGILDGTKILQPPVALFHFSPGEIPVNKRIEFDASQSYDPDGEIVSYQWNFGDGNVSTDPAPIYAYSIAGEYVIMLVVVDNDDVASSRLSIVQVEEKPSSSCFIATAAYATPMADEIQILREFRDEYMLTNAVGQILVGLYYRVSPPIAEFITEHPSLKPAVRAGLLPAVAMSAVAVNTSAAEKMAIVGLLVLVSVAVAIWAVRRRGRGPEYTRG